MNTRLCVIIAVLLASSCVQASGQDKRPADLKRNDVFGPDKLWTIHLRIGVKEYEDMQPEGGGSFPGGFPGGFPKKDKPKEEPKKVRPKVPGEKRDSRISAFGVEFPYVKAELEFEGKTLKEVAVRYKGNSTYQASASGPKRPFRVDVNHYDDEQKIFGLGALVLGNNVMDATRVKEALAYALFRAAKVPAPRTAFVKLHLTVPAKYDKLYLGVYTLMEPVDKNFLRSHFDDDEGMLLKPERLGGLSYLGERWDFYKNTYRPKREPTKEQARRLIEFTKLVNRADTATFRAKIADYLDVDEFLRFVAVNSLIANLDSFLSLGHNYYLYLDSKTNRFHFIPWDLDLSFGGMSMFSPLDEQIEWSIAKPYLGKNPLIERVLAIEDYNRAFRGHLRDLTENALSRKTLNDTLTGLEETVRRARDKKGPGPGFGMFGGRPLRDFMAKRVESVTAQLDGKSEGKVLSGFSKLPGKGPPKKGPL